MNEISVGLRLGTMLLDHFIICLTGIPPIIIYESLTNSNSVPAAISSYPIVPLFVIYFCKDCIGGRSPAKRILKLVVVDNKTHAPATPLQSLIRNLFILIWPIEACVAFFNQKRRIGDRVAGTKLIRHTGNEKWHINFKQIAVSILVATLLACFVFRLFDTIL
jgi:uncharacterized RDD family membrane protein YckC